MKNLGSLICRGELSEYEQTARTVCSGFEMLLPMIMGLGSMMMMGGNKMPAPPPMEPIPPPTEPPNPPLAPTNTAAAQRARLKGYGAGGNQDIVLTTPGQRKALISPTMGM